MALMPPPEGFPPGTVIESVPEWVETRSWTDDDQYAENADGCASLVFYLTRHLTKEQDAEIRREIERQERFFDKLIYYHTWTVSEKREAWLGPVLTEEHHPIKQKDADGTLDDVERIAAKVKDDSRTKESPVVYFIDRQSGVDCTVLIVSLTRADARPSAIRTRGRILGRLAHCAVVNESIANMDLVEYLEDTDPQSRATLDFHHESDSDVDLEAAPDSPLQNGRL